MCFMLWNISIQMINRIIRSLFICLMFLILFILILIYNLNFIIMVSQRFIDVETSVNSVIQDNLSISKCTIDQLMAVLQLAPVNSTITIRVQEFKPEEK